MKKDDFFWIPKKERVEIIRSRIQEVLWFYGTIHFCVDMQSEDSYCFDWMNVIEDDEDNTELWTKHMFGLTSS